MKYNEVVKAVFIERKNRFIAVCEIGGKCEEVHVPNTGRCGELFVPGAEVYVRPENITGGRKTAWTLVSVDRQGRLFNVESTMANRVFREAVEKKQLVLPGIGDVVQVKREVTFCQSRLDFLVHGTMGDAYVEVKGVTLEEDGIAKFPDAPTQRGIKHLQTLARAVDRGYGAFAVFVLQFAGPARFEPNYKTHKEFAEALKIASECGVQIIAFDCNVTESEITYKNLISVEI